MITCKYFRSHILQADSKEMYDAWVSSLQKGIGAALQRVNTNSIEMDDKSQSFQSTLSVVASNGNLKHDSNEKGKKLRKVRLVRKHFFLNNFAFILLFIL